MGLDNKEQLALKSVLAETEAWAALLKEIFTAVTRTSPPVEARPSTHHRKPVTT